MRERECKQDVKKQLGMDNVYIQWIEKEAQNKKEKTQLKETKVRKREKNFRQIDIILYDANVYLYVVSKFIIYIKLLLKFLVWDAIEERERVREKERERERERVRERERKEERERVSVCERERVSETETDQNVVFISNLLRNLYKSMIYVLLLQYIVSNVSWM